MIGPLSYIGGKNRLARKIIAMMPEHTTYVEPFAGGAQVFFHKQPSEVELLNDMDGEIVNFFRVCQAHFEELIRYLRFTLVSRGWFDLLQRTSPESLTDIQRAARFFYLQKNAYAGLVVRRAYKHCVAKTPNYNPGRIPEIIAKAHDRLQNVQIENLPYGQILDKCDRPTTLFYLDPPYWNRKLYRFNFVETDFTALEQRLRELKGKFILSLNDEPEVRALFSRFNIEAVDLHYTAQQKSGKRFGEVIITNY